MTEMIICSNCGGEYHGVNPCPPYVKVVKLLLTENEARAVLDAVDARLTRTLTSGNEQAMTRLRDVKRKLASGLNVPGIGEPKA